MRLAARHSHHSAVPRNGAERSSRLARAVTDKSSCVVGPSAAAQHRAGATVVAQFGNRRADGSPRIAARTAFAVNVSRGGQL